MTGIQWICSPEMGERGQFVVVPPEELFLVTFTADNSFHTGEQLRTRAQLLSLYKMATTTTETETIPTTRLEPITASNILRLFPDIDTSSEALDGHDVEQIRLMDEVCIVLDDNDKPIGNFSKKICMYSYDSGCRKY